MGFRASPQRQVLPSLQLRFGNACIHAQLARSFVERHNFFQRRPSAEYRNRAVTQFGIKANDCLSREVGNEDASKHETLKNSSRFSVLSMKFLVHPSLVSSVPLSPPW